MTETDASAGRSDTCIYEIRVKGHLDRRWAAWFEGLVLERAAGGITVVRGEVADQAALHGLLQQMRDLGLPLISVVQVNADQPSDPSPSTSPNRRSSS